MARFILGVILIALPTGGAAVRAEPAPILYYLTAADDRSGVLIAYQRQEETKVDLTNVRMRRGYDIEKFPLIGNPQYLKWSLLKYGAACLADPRKATEDERLQQRRAAVCDRPPATKSTSASNAPPLNPERQKAAPATPTSLQRFGKWVWDSWEQLFGLGAIVLIFLMLRRLLAAIKSWRGRRTVNLIIAGVPSAGKSALYKRLVDLDVDEREIEALEQSPASATAKLEKIPSGRLTFVPHLRDIPGSFSGEVIDAFVPKHLDGGKRAKTVLVVVLAPVGLRSGKIEHASADYLDQQEGWSILIKAIAQSKLLRRPSLIVIFMNKCDMYRELANHGDLAARMESEFAPIIAGITKAADESKIQTMKIYGSALKRINMDDFLGKISTRLQKQMTGGKR